MQDAFQDRFDTALLISADSDLVGPVLAVQKLFPGKRVIVACPPNRYSANLCNAASGSFKIGRASIREEPVSRDNHDRVRICSHAAAILEVRASG
jgi:uncharacterized LabA/DUF88 family protein